MDKIITLDYGSGGKKTSELIDNIIVKSFDNSPLSALGDGAILGDLAFSTDSFVVSPLFFPGGDIGELAVFGTVNDLSMCGAEAKYLSCGLILEEGLETETLEKVISSMKAAADRAGVRIVTGDTKVVEKGRGDGLYINTAGIGTLKYPHLGKNRICPGDKVIVSGTVGDHGTAVMLARSGMMKGSLKSDCACLKSLALRLLADCGDSVRILRDPTRGGLATTLNEFTEGSQISVELEEAAIPVRGDVSMACSILGLDPLYCANEGKMICIVSPEAAEAALQSLRAEETGEHAEIIGTVTTNYPGKVVIHTKAGGSRILQKLAGAQLPRIC